MLLQYAIPPLPMSPGLPIYLQSLAQDFNRLQNEIASSASNYFEVKGDLIVFKNTDDLAKNIHAVIVKLNDAAQTAVKTLNNYATTVRALDDRTLCAYVLAKFMDLRTSDPSLMQLLGLLAAGEISVASGEIARLAESLLRKLATLIEQKSKPLAKAANSPTIIRLGVWAALKNNAFNWRTRQFEASGGVAKFANWYRLNPTLAKAKGDVQAVALSALFSTALARAGLPGPAIQPTADFLASVAMDQS